MRQYFFKKIESNILNGLGYIENLEKKSESNQEQHHKTLAKLGSCFFTLVYKFDNIAIWLYNFKNYL